MKRGPVIISIFVLLLIIGYVIHGHYTILHIEFNGKVDKITYNEKGFPRVIINKQSYGFSFGIHNELKVGDSLIKKKGSIQVEQYRNGKNIETFEWR